jgi:hypothetical protein
MGPSPQAAGYAITSIDRHGHCPGELPSSSICYPVLTLSVDKCSLPIDIVLVSKRDGGRFGGHLQNLSRFSEGFVPQIAPESLSLAGAAEVENVMYDESGTVLKLLLQFMHSETPPDLRTLPFDVVLEFTFAAYKYILYHTMPTCVIYLEYVIMPCGRLRLVRSALIPIVGLRLSNIH